MMNPSPQNSKEHLKTILTFLKENGWIYNYPNTHILVNRVFDNFQQEWLPYLKNITNAKLNGLPFGDVNENWPISLKQFIKKIQDLKCEVQSCNLATEVVELPQTINVSLKKRHEIARLTAKIHSVCKTLNISIVIDVGAGLGYLSQLLYDKFRYKVLGIEGNKRNLELALTNQENFYPHSKNSVRYVHHFVTENSLAEITRHLKENFCDWQEQENVCITGLHACADLSVTILNVFAQLDYAKSLIVMPCCYHRLEMQNCASDEERFKNFPASKTLSAVYNDLKGEFFMKRPFLRLACQQSSDLWRNMSASDHVRHSRSCMFRAIVQEVAHKENLDVKRLKRKTGKFKPGSDCNIGDYINNLKHTHELVPKEEYTTQHKIQLIDDPVFKSKLLEKWEEHKENCYLVEILTAFQTSIQGICENVVLLDRVEFLREKGLDCNVYKVTDDRISPRCHALVATKVQTVT